MAPAPDPVVLIRILRENRTDLSKAPPARGLAVGVAPQLGFAGLAGTAVFVTGGDAVNVPAGGVALPLFFVAPESTFRRLDPQAW